jgi:membrane protease YdiL (CAAX protease family)
VVYVVAETEWKNLLKMLADLKLHAQALGILAIVLGALLFIVWRPRGVPKQLVGPQRWPEIPWQLTEVLLSVFLVSFLLPALIELAPWSRPTLEPQVYAAYQPSAAATALYGPMDHGLSGGFATIAGALGSYPAEKARQITMMRALLINRIVLLPISLALLILLLARLANARPYQMGLHLSHWRENLLLGYVAWLIATPVALLVFFFVRLDFWQTIWGRPLEHPIAQILAGDASLVTYFLTVGAACLAAPLVEEVLMRGVVQPYLVRMPIVSDMIIILAMIFALSFLLTPGLGGDRGNGMGPVLFVALIAPGYYFFERWTRRWLPEPGAGRGVFAASLVFAALHSGAWPSPIPLFLLSLALGALAYRTGSLIGPILLHLLFNATTLLAVGLVRDWTVR